MTDRTREDAAAGKGYDVLAPLASGTYGENLLAVRKEPLGLGKLFVLRQLRRSLSNDAKVRVAFVEMAKRAVRLSHPNVIHTYEIGERGGALYVVTEYLEGESLDAVLSAITPAPNAVDARLWLLIACEALSGLHYAHELRDFDGSPLGMVHGGVSPRRLFIGYSGRVVVTDFGVSTLARHAHRIEGTYLPEMVSYTAPEQRAGKGCDRRADVFSLGLILWELLAGKRHRHPTDLETPIEKLTPLREIKDSIDPELSAIVAKATDLDPEKRFATALEFRKALEAHVDLALLRRNALADSMTALFSRTRDKIPSLLARRMERLAKQDPLAITLGEIEEVVPESVSEADLVEEEEEEEEAFLLAAPIETVAEDAVLSVRELVSASELLGEGGADSSDSSRPAPREEEAAPDSAMMVSSVELLVPVDLGSGRSLDGGAATESTPALTQRSPGSEPKQVAAVGESEDASDDGAEAPAPAESEEKLTPAAKVEPQSETMKAAPRVESEEEKEEAKAEAAPEPATAPAADAAPEAASEGKGDEQPASKERARSERPKAYVEGSDKVEETDIE